MVTSVVKLSSNSDVLVELGLVDEGKIHVGVISRAGGATKRIFKNGIKAAYVAECGTPRITKCKRKGHESRVRQCLVYIKLLVERG